ncbi:ATP-binding protein [Solwaraspora sp. WMMA2059]|uniref:ATP-binding protein n=1 Tax=Solwaraspora sp. WMMA2059 TaxID=3015160 RepID=UPI00248C173F|nr:ATP-binding protein [Solwaraspora sp. WMMA2059]WBB96397.1 ATP-binding protein [Solwaraspora sp. WMMA2059]
MSDGRDILERRILEPDPGLVKSLGMHHTLESAIADLVDNSIDANASRILIQFETSNRSPVGLVVIDNGEGMNDEQVDEAMRLGRQRKYNRRDQGHFGIGLKAASFSHASTLALYTTTDRLTYHGRRLRQQDVQRDYGCDVLLPDSFRDDAIRRLDRIGAKSGTIVKWSHTRFPKFTALASDDWMEGARTRTRMHLGLIYHRLIKSGRLRIEVEILDTDRGEAGWPEPVVAVDPLEFGASAVSGYPKVIDAKIAGEKIRLVCHIIPPKSSGPSFRLYGRDGAEFQGFYIYRNDRLLQAGGWNDVIVGDRKRSLARVVIDDFDVLSKHVRMNPEKSGITFSHELGVGIAKAAASARADVRVSFADYIARAEDVLVESRRRTRRARSPVAEPSKGLHEDIRRVIRSEIPIRRHEEPVEVRWRQLPKGRFIELDPVQRVIYLNKYYRTMLTGGRTGLSDAPLLKTLVFLLTEKVFGGHYWGPRDKDLVEMWDAVLGAAVQVELDYRNGAR